MKNKLPLIAIFAAASLLFSCSSGNDSETTADTEPSRPENGVYYEYSSGGNSDRISSSITYENGKEISSNEYDYWDDGRLKSITTKIGGKVTDTWSYNYTEEGLLSQMVRTYTEDASELRDDYRYNENGNLDSLSWYEGDSYCGGLRYSYNDRGETALEEQLDANGDVITYTEYLFDDSGKTQSAHKYMYGNEVSYSLYEYNENGLLRSVKYYSGSDELTQEVRNEYNSDGKLVKVLNCDPSGAVLSHTECLYDENGFNYRDIFYENGTPVYCYDYTEDGAPVYSEY